MNLVTEISGMSSRKSLVLPPGSGVICLIFLSVFPNTADIHSLTSGSVDSAKSEGDSTESVIWERHFLASFLMY